MGVKSVPNAMPQVSVVVTVRNEELALPALLTAITNQRKLPNEVVIVDGGSTDGTWQLLTEWKHDIKKQAAAYPFHVKLVRRDGSISVGRNEGVRQATHSFIAMTDAGCLPNTDWLAQLLRVATQSNSTDLVVAGRTIGDPQTLFEEAVVPFVLPPIAFQDLPATRSMLFSKSIWQRVGGFDEHLRVSEDYVFAKKVKDHLNSQVVMLHAPQAVVQWRPRSNFIDFAKMVWGHAYYDQIGGVRRAHVQFIFLRYLIGFALLGFVVFRISTSGFEDLYGLISSLILLVGFVSYSIWPIYKHINRVSPAALLYLPIIQYVTDSAVMGATLCGCFIKPKLV